MSSWFYLNIYLHKVTLEKYVRHIYLGALVFLNMKEHPQSFPPIPVTWPPFGRTVGGSFDEVSEAVCFISCHSDSLLVI